MMNDLASASPAPPTLSPAVLSALPSHLPTHREHHSHSLDETRPPVEEDSTPHRHLRRGSTGDMFNEQAPKDRIDLIADYLYDRMSEAGRGKPLIGVICGSGLGAISDLLVKPLVIKYADIPQFPQSTVQGHAGELVLGELDGVQVVAMKGRFHAYEGYAMRELALPIRVLYLLGIRYLIVTNAAGGLNPDYNIGDLMILNDHLNMPGLAGQHPLVGPNDARFGDRFTPLSACYDRKLQDMAYGVAERLQLAHKVRRRGVYCFVSGPTYETPTECRFLRLVGGDAVGMSTVPEVIVAAHCGLKILGLSLITNKVLYPGEDGSAANHEEVLEAVQATQSDILNYVSEIIRSIGAQHKN